MTHNITIMPQQMSTETGNTEHGYSATCSCQHWAAMANTVEAVTLMAENHAAAAFLGAFDE